MRFKDLISPRRWFSFHLHLIKKYLAFWGEEPAPEQFKIEQFMFRYIKCSECLNDGSCTHCGCAIPSRMHIEGDYCSNNRWGMMLTNQEWIDYKKNFNVEFKLKVKDNEYIYRTKD